MDRRLPRVNQGRYVLHMAENKEVVKLQVEVTVALTRSEAFEGFVRELGGWWPREYSWAQNVLERIAMEPKVGGACYEIGPHGFRCDWGRVTRYAEPEGVAFLWQISPNREPIPDPAKSSEVEVRFFETAAGTRVLLEHRNFENHGSDALQYRDALASEMGWPKILEAFRKYAEG
jgi:uncharacterized protein YndB with AHSA1/START domain